jgi:hypothetical protein
VTRFRQGTIWAREKKHGLSVLCRPHGARLDWICGLALITLAGALMKRERLVGRVSVEGVGRASDGGVYRKSQARPAASSPKVLLGLVP